MRKRVTLASLMVGVLALLSGCESLESQAGRTGSNNQIARGGAAANPLVHGKRTPGLVGEERALYTQALARLQQEGNDASTFDVSAAVAAELDADTRYLIAHQRTATAFAITSRANNIRSNMQMRELPPEVQLLSGEVENGKINGPFDAIVRYGFLGTSAGMTFQTESTQRVRGTMKNGMLDGPLTITRRMENASHIHSATNWSAVQIVFEDNQPVGTSLVYSEHPEFNVTGVTRHLPNGVSRTRAYIGDQLSSVSSTYQDRLQGMYQTYADGRALPSVYYWEGVETSNPLYVRTPEGKAPSTLVGIGMRLPQQVSGPFQVRDVFYPSPASDAGLLPEDIVVSIDGQRLTSAHNAAAIAQMLAGAEGTQVVLEVDRPGHAGLKTITITRGKFQMIEPGP